MTTSELKLSKTMWPFPLSVFLQLPPKIIFNPSPWTTLLHHLPLTCFVQLIQIVFYPLFSRKFVWHINHSHFTGLYQHSTLLAYSEEGVSDCLYRPSFPATILASIIQEATDTECSIRLNTVCQLSVQVLPASMQMQLVDLTNVLYGFLLRLVFHVNSVGPSLVFPVFVAYVTSCLKCHKCAGITIDFSANCLWNKFPVR